MTRTTFTQRRVWASSDTLMRQQGWEFVTEQREDKNTVYVVVNYRHFTVAAPFGN